MNRRELLLGIASAVAFETSGRGGALADSYPARPVKLIVSGVAGAAIDLVTRALADELSTTLKQSFIVEDRPGAGGNLGAEVVARSAPDGYTLLVALDTTLTVNPSLYKKLPFDPDVDLRPIAILASSSTMLVVHPSIPVNSVAEFVAFAKKDAIPYAHGGNGTPGHLSMEYFRMLAGFPAVPVPYRGSAQLIGDLVAGQIKLGFVSTATVLEHVRAGRLKGLAISAGRRAPQLPEIRTMAEAGYPDFRVELYYVMMAPARTPDSIIDLLEREVVQALKSSDFQARFRPQDIAIEAITGAAVKNRLVADRKLWAKVAKAADMRVE
jgi:tripartite-type tricarboxylate transporter receptor subunit TctC